MWWWWWRSLPLKSTFLVIGEVTEEKNLWILWIVNRHTVSDTNWLGQRNSISSPSMQLFCLFYCGLVVATQGHESVYSLQPKKTWGKAWLVSVDIKPTLNNLSLLFNYLSLSSIGRVHFNLCINCHIYLS